LQKESLGAKNKSRKGIVLGGCTHVDLTDCNLMDAANETENVLFQSTDRSYALIDFVYRKGNMFYAFQAASGETHDGNVTKIRELAKYVGGPQNLYFYFLVTSYMFTAFVTNPVNTVKSIQKLIEKNITQAEKQKEVIKKRRTRKNPPSDEEFAVESAKVQEKIVHLTNELEGPWNIYVAMIKDPNISFDANGNIWGYVANTTSPSVEEENDEIET
jgi:hypothetical protein